MNGLRRASPEVEHGQGVSLSSPGHEVVIGTLWVGRHPLPHQPPVGNALLRRQQYSIMSVPIEVGGENPGGGHLLDPLSFLAVVGFP